MRLKLETQDRDTILSVTEIIEPQNIPVLKAGLTKIFQSGRKAVLLDLLEAQAPAPPVARALRALAGWALEQEAVLVAVSRFPELGPATTRAEGLALFGTSIPRLLALESKLAEKVENLEAERAQAEKKLAAPGPAAQDLSKARRANSDLKTLIASLEREVHKQLAARTSEPHLGGSLPPKHESLNRLLHSILEREGVIPIT